MRLNWDEVTLLRCIGYLANPVTGTRIEFEVPYANKVLFELKYQELTNHELFLDGSRPPYYIVPKTKSKFGTQGRIYFKPEGDIPDAIKEIFKSGRNPDERRINRTELVFYMLGFGFDFEKTDLKKIVENVNSMAAHHDEFWEGFAAAEANNTHKHFQSIPVSGPPPWFGDVRYERVPASVSYTYLLQFGKNPIWKVGFTKNIERRLKDINAHVPFEFTGECWMLRRVRNSQVAYRAFELEQAILKKLNDCRGSRERIQCDANTIYNAWDEITRKI